MANPFEEVVRPEFAAGLARDVLAPVPANPRDGLTPAFRAGMQNRTETSWVDLLALELGKIRQRPDHV